MPETVQELKAKLEEAQAEGDAVREGALGCRTFSTPGDRRRWLIENRQVIGQLIDQLEVAARR